MKISLAIAVWLISPLVLVHAATTPENSGEPLPLKSDPVDIALDQLLSERGSEADLKKAIAVALKAGVSAQAILEARFLYHVDRREDSALASMLPEFLKQRDLFQPEQSAIFRTKEDWLAVVEYVQAIAALKKNDRSGFKTHITEAFWLSPSQAAAFAPHIERMRLEEAMDGITLDFKSLHLPVQGGAAVALGSVAPARKATVLHFWSAASEECIASLPDYATTARKLSEKSIAMISIVPSHPPEVLTKTRELLKPPATRPPGAWLIDSDQHSLATLLRIQNLPAFVMLSNEGQVLFNGDPSDEGFWDALRSVDESIVRPNGEEE